MVTSVTQRCKENQHITPDEKCPLVKVTHRLRRTLSKYCCWHVSPPLLSLSYSGQEVVQSRQINEWWRADKTIRGHCSGRKKITEKSKNRHPATQFDTPHSKWLWSTVCIHTATSSPSQHFQPGSSAPLRMFLLKRLWSWSSSSSSSVHPKSPLEMYQIRKWGVPRWAFRLLVSMLLH